MIDCFRIPGCWYVLRSVRALLLLCTLSLLASCMLGPDYARPAFDVGVQFKETPGWKPAQPQLAAVPSGAWWLMYDDVTLTQLMQELNVANQNIAQAEARFRQAVALTQGSRAPLLPSVSATGGTTRSGGLSYRPWWRGQQHVN